MLKKFVSSLICLLMLVGCSSGSKTTAEETPDASGETTTEETTQPDTTEFTSKFNVSDISADIVNQLGISETTTAIDKPTAAALFQIDESLIYDCSVYIANDNSADIVGVFSCYDTDAVEKSLNQYLKVTTDTFKAYDPDEAAKCENALVSQKYDLVFIIVSNDQETAKSLVFAIE